MTLPVNILKPVPVTKNTSEYIIEGMQNIYSVVKIYIQQVTLFILNVSDKDGPLTNNGKWSTSLEFLSFKALKYYSSIWKIIF